MKNFTLLAFCCVAALWTGMIVQHYQDLVVLHESNQKLLGVLTTAEKCFASAEAVTLEASRCTRTLEVLHGEQKPNRRREYVSITEPVTP